MIQCFRVFGAVGMSFCWWAADDGLAFQGLGLLTGLGFPSFCAGCEVDACRCSRLHLKFRHGNASEVPQSPDSYPLFLSGPKYWHPCLCHANPH